MGTTYNAYQTPMVAPQAYQLASAASYYQPLPSITIPNPEKQRPTPAVSAQTASTTLQRLIALELHDAGFHSAPGDVMKRFEWEVQAFVQRLFKQAHEYAVLANRDTPSLADVATPCFNMGYTPSKLKTISVKSRRKSRKRRRHGIASTPQLIEAPTRESSPELLGSDDEGVPSQPIVPVTLRYQLQTHFPKLPPKHTYIRTPAVPPKRAALPSLEKKLKTASLVQASLHNLLTSTEDNEEHKDAEVLGHIVNWQSGSHPRKRWKLT